MSAVPAGKQFEIMARPHHATLVKVDDGIRTHTCAGRNNLIVLDPGQSITTRWDIHPD